MTSLRVALRRMASSSSGGLGRATFDTSILLGLRLATVAVSLLLVTRLLGPAQYGAYAVALSLATLLGVLANLGNGYVMLARSGEGQDAVAAVWRYAWPMSL